jgi:WD40 repeat protein
VTLRHNFIIKLDNSYAHVDVQLWSTKTQNCLRSCAAGYGVSVAFAPGSRYVINGTKDGHVKIIDTTSGNLIIDENAHPDSAVWAIAVRPDGKGKLTSPI